MTSAILYKNCEDPELLKLLMKDDYAAFTEIYNRYIDEVYQFTRKLKLDESDSHDIIQEVFTSIWTRREQLQIENLRAWLFVSVKKQMLYQLRKKKYSDQYSQSVIDFVSPYYDPILEIIHEKELQAFIEQQIQQLPPRMKEVFEMSRKEFLSYREIAEKLDVSEKTVRKQVSNVLKIFRFKLNRTHLEVILLLLYYSQKNS